MQNEILLSKETGNYFFGFHDIVAWNAQGDRLACLKNNDIKLPPSLNNPCEVGFLDSKGHFNKLGDTLAYNYPQGSREQWIGDSNLLITNDKVDQSWGSKIYDTDSSRLIETLNFPTHVITDDGWAFGIDYSRLNRVGGYGYTGITDRTADENAPQNSGILKHHVFKKEHKLILSIRQVANFKAKENIGKNHYITHLLLSPNQKRIAFLHRYKLSDGGETTRLMTIDLNGENLHLLGTGFLSHFDWKDNENIVIWGRTGTHVERLRNSITYRLIPAGILSFMKKQIKALHKKPYTDNSSNSVFKFWVYRDEDNSSRHSMASDVIFEDGHPMFCPANRDWMVCDTYPNKEGVRTLYIYQASTNSKINLGNYKMIGEKPDLIKSKINLSGVDEKILKSFSLEQMAFTRSGLHCDLHPRWKRDGTMVCFDSIHDGRRLIYGYDVSQYIK